MDAATAAPISTGKVAYAKTMCLRTEPMTRPCACASTHVGHADHGEERTAQGNKVELAASSADIVTAVVLVDAEVATAGDTTNLSGITRTV